MSVCPSCGTENPKEQTFCSCGVNLSAAKLPALPQSKSESRIYVREGGLDRRWIAAIVLVLALAGGAIGYVAGSLGDGDSDLGQDLEPSTSSSPGVEEPVVTENLPEVLCAKGFGPVTLEARREPEECTFLRDGAPANPAGVDFTAAVGLVWTEWSEERALADGAFIQMGRNLAEFELFGPRNICGRTVFTRIRIARPGYAELPAGRIEDCP